MNIILLVSGIIAAFAITYIIAAVLSKVANFVYENIAYENGYIGKAFITLIVGIIVVGVIYIIQIL